ncbi:hypothetical protein RHMOL_Rhmol12G0168500 [Rhododendron molle]|uniref:Uncharacterized protein n=1 Tax=Rhododendron molle TaxID=49168 RepID=A0ACC0LIV3_RHOML|nr:hypothetical protein RHMOL_Rhmol12G0168500 [Rhododendron molle]
MSANELHAAKKMSRRSHLHRLNSLCIPGYCLTSCPVFTTNLLIQLLTGHLCMCNDSILVYAFQWESRDILVLDLLLRLYDDGRWSCCRRWRLCGLDGASVQGCLVAAGTEDVAVAGAALSPDIGVVVRLIWGLL